MPFTSNIHKRGWNPLELFKLLGTIAIDNQKANSEIDETTDLAEKSVGKMSKAFKAIGKAVAVAFAADKIKDFGAKCIEVAAEVKATNSQFEQTFGDMQQAASDAINRVAEDSGIVETRLKGIGTSIYAFAKTTGMESTEALGMMEEALQVAADSAAYYDRSLEDTTESLKSFLKGNFENDAALGLSCTETTRNAAANKLYGKSFIELSESQKQLTLLQMVKDANELSGAMGQAARESDGWENVTGNLKESLKQLMATIGQPILSAAVPIVKKLSDGFEWLNTVVTDFLQNSGVSEKLQEFADRVMPAVEKAWRTILKPTFQAIGQILENVVFPIVETVFGLMLDTIATTVEAIQTVIEEGFELIEKYIVDPIKSAYDTIKGIIDDIKDAVSDAIKSVKSFLGIEGKLNITTTSRTTSLAKHAEGGILTKPTIFGYTPSSGTYHMGGEAGAEAVAPIDKLQGYVAAAVAEQNSGLLAVLQAILQAILDKDTKVYLNSKEISKAVNKDLGVVF